MNRFAAHAVRISHLKARFVLGVRLQVQNAAGEHLGRGVIEAEILAEHLFAPETEKRHPLFPVILSGFPIADFDDSIAVVIARDLPLEAQADQSRTLHHELTWAHRIHGREHGSRQKEKAENALQRKDAVSCSHA